MMNNDQGLGRLLAAIREMPAQPRGHCLDQEQMMSYTQETLSEKETEEVYQHLESCPRCAEEVEILMEVQSQWDAEVDARHVAQKVAAVLWLQAVTTISFAARRLSRVRCSGVRYDDGKSKAEGWEDPSQQVACLLAEEREGFVFSVNSRNPDHQGQLVRFALTDSTSGQESVTGFVVLHLKAGYYCGSAKLSREVELPPECQPHLSVVQLAEGKEPDRGSLLAAVDAAAKEEDKNAWQEWAKREHQAGLLSETLAGEIGSRRKNT